MRILWCQTVPYLPEDHGGGLSNTHAFSLALKARGCQIAVVARKDRQRYSIRSLWPAVPDLGYSVIRSLDPLREVVSVCGTFKPDVAIVQFEDAAGMVTALNNIGVPSLVYFQDVFAVSGAGGAATAYAACSSVVAEAAASVLGHPTAVVPVLIDAAAYRVPRTGTAVTLINPIPRKGVEIAFSLAARRPDIQFEFVEAWRLRGRVLNYLERRVEHHGNITFTPRTHDMKSVYRRSRLIFAPSLGVEAWGRTVSEGQVSGIPALASDSGGLPQAVGPGGTIVGRDAPIAAWSAALDQLWDDRAYYEAKSAAALAHSERQEFQPNFIIDRLLAILKGLKRQ